jgi:hypothetical protein
VGGLQSTAFNVSLENSQTRTLSLLSFFDEKPAESSRISESKIPLQLFDVHVPSALWYPSKEKQGGKTARKKKRKIPMFPAIESLQKAFDCTKANLW